MEPTPPTPATRPWWALVVAVVALAAAIVLLVRTPEGATDAPTAMLEVAPGGTVELAALPAEHQHLYRAAADTPEVFEQVACYCGCEAFLDHRHLLDCFVRPDGGWERHATGCAVCLAEARDVVDLDAEQTAVEDIVRQIDRRYGGITGNA